MQRRPARKQKSTVRKDYVTVTNRSYGAALRGTKIYFEGARPRGLSSDGRISLGKHILEALTRTFPRFRWIITRADDSIEMQRGIVRVRTSQGLLSRMGKEEWSRRADIKNDIVRRFFAAAFPQHFATTSAPIYVSGTLARVLAPNILSRLSSEDRDALSRFLPAFIASESVGSVNLLKASAEINTLRELAATFARELDQNHGESWWHTFIESNILLMQQGYIKALGKLNISVGNTKFPDFSLVSHDSYLDILEIKTPQTSVLREDSSRSNYYFDTEIAKAIVQTENYIDNVGRHADAIRSFLLDEYSLAIKAVRPRGIILAGDARKFTIQKQRDDFRLLSQGIKNISLITYDELLTRLQNYIQVLETFCQPVEAAKKAKKEQRKRKPRKSHQR